MTNQLEQLILTDPTISTDDDMVLTTCTGARISPTEVGRWITATDRTGRFPLRFKTTKASPGVKVFNDRVSDRPKYRVELTWGTTVGLRTNDGGFTEAVFPASSIRSVVTEEGY